MEKCNIAGYDRLIISVVSRNSGEKLVEAARNAGAKGATIVQCRCSSDNALLQFLGIDESDNDMVLILVDSSSFDTIFSAVLNSSEEHRLSGFSVVQRLSSVMKCIVSETGCRVENIETGAEKMENRPSHEMITVIVNSGYAEDVMAAARKAGAKGGTILNARGTGKEEDVKFFGISIVPEKEVLLLVTEKEKSAEIIGSIKDLVCFSTPGSGICFTSDVENFTVLGKNRNK